MEIPYIGCGKIPIGIVDRRLPSLVHCSCETVTGTSIAVLSSTTQIRLRKIPAYGMLMSGRGGNVLKVMDGRTAKVRYNKYYVRCILVH